MADRQDSSGTAVFLPCDSTRERFLEFCVLLRLMCGVATECAGEYRRIQDGDRHGRRAHVARIAFVRLRVCLSADTARGGTGHGKLSRVRSAEDALGAGN